MDNDYTEELIKDFIYKFIDGLDIAGVEHELRTLITKVILHEQVDDGIGEP